MENDGRPSEERREFITKCGRFALVTPPAITLLLAADGRAYAQATSPLVDNSNGNGNGNGNGKRRGWGRRRKGQK